MANTGLRFSNCGTLGFLLHFWSKYKQLFHYEWYYLGKLLKYLYCRRLASSQRRVVTLLGMGHHIDNLLQRSQYLCLIVRSVITDLKVRCLALNQLKMQECDENIQY